MLDSQICVNIEDGMATVEVIQSFVNDGLVPLEAEYLSSPNQSAAINGMEMRVEDEIIQTVIRDKQVAVVELEQAVQEGKAAGLLT